MLKSHLFAPVCPPVSPDGFTPDFSVPFRQDPPTVVSVSAPFDVSFLDGGSPWFLCLLRLDWVLDVCAQDPERLACVSLVLRHLLCQAVGVGLGLPGWDLPLPQRHWVCARVLGKSVSYLTSRVSRLHCYLYPRSSRFSLVPGGVALLP